MKILCIPADTLLDNMPSADAMAEAMKNEKASRLDHLIHYCQSMLGQETANALAEKSCKFSVMEVEAGDIAIIPPGWTTGSAVMGEQPASGVRIAFLSNTKATSNIFKRLLEHGSSKLQPFVELLDLNAASVAV